MIAARTLNLQCSDSVCPRSCCRYLREWSGFSAHSHNCTESRLSSAQQRVGRVIVQPILHRLGQMHVAGGHTRVAMSKHLCNLERRRHARYDAGGAEAVAERMQHQLRLQASPLSHTLPFAVTSISLPRRGTNTGTNLEAGGERRGQSSLRCSFKDKMASGPDPAPPLGTQQVFERGAKPLPTAGSCLPICRWNYLAAHNANARWTRPFKPRRFTAFNDHRSCFGGEGINIESGGHWLKLAVARGYDSRRGLDHVNLPCLKFAASRAQYSSAVSFDLKFQYRRIPLQIVRYEGPYDRIICPLPCRHHSNL